jgi:hypothetical protein
MSKRRDDAADVRRELSDVRRVVEALGLGVGAKRQARGLVVRCPAHNERDASCSITRGPDATIRVKCFSCGFAGDVFHLVAAAEGIALPRDFPKALQRARELGRATPADPPAQRRATRPEAPDAPPVLDGSTFAASAAALLEACPLYSGVAAGLRARGLLFEAQGDGWGELPRDRPGPFEGDGRSELGTALEAVRPKFEPASLRWLISRDRVVWGEHRLLIPWRRPDGSIWGLQRRYAPFYGDEAPVGRTPKYVWPSESVYSPAPRYAYGVDSPALETGTDLWLVEGAVDVLALRALARAGALGAEVPPRPAVLGLPGVEMWGRFGPSVLRYVRGRRVLVAFDADKAGDRAAKGSKAMVDDLLRAGARTIDRRRPLGFKDWGELAADRLGFGREARGRRHGDGCRDGAGGQGGR